MARLMRNQQLSMGLLQLCFLFLSILLVCRLNEAKDTLPSDENVCTSQWNKGDMARRFSSDQIRWMCVQQVKWKRMLRHPANDAPGITKRQAAYLDFIGTCKGSECVHRFPSDEEERTTSSNSRNDPRCKWSKKEWRPTFCPNACKPGNGKKAKKGCAGNSGVKKKGKRQTTTGGPAKKVLRKEYRTLTEEERNSLHAAFNQLKSTKVDGVSKYDLFTSYHYTAQAPGAHWGPGLLPWHREFLRRIETALQNEVPDVSLAYWDSTLDYGLPDARDSLLWTPPYMGNGDGIVTSGPFANWDAATPLPDMENVTKLYRAIGASPLGDLFRPTDVDWFFKRTNYSQLTACVDPTFELVHGLPHVWVGGYMLVIRVSPNDPVFYLHHSYLDYLWEQFRRTVQNASQRTRDWAPDDKLCSDSHKFDAPMSPFEPLKNSDGLSDDYTRVWYDYAPGPAQCSSENPTCGSSVLWCDVKERRCRAKIRLAGNCTGLQGSDVCFQSTCNGVICVKDSRTRRPSLTDERTPPTPSSMAPLPTAATSPPDVTAGPIVTNSPALADTSPRQSIPTGYYNTPSPSPPGDTVYIKTVMVNEQGPVTGGLVTVEGVNYDGSSRANAVTQMDAIYPETPGVVYVKIRDPTLKQVKVRLSAKDSSGQPCKAYCARAPYGSNNGLGSSDPSYSECNGTISVSSQMEVSDPVPFTKINDAKRFLGADLKGHPSQWTVMTPFLCFLCNSDNAGKTMANQRVFNDLVGKPKLDWSSSDHVWFHILVLDGRVPYSRGVPNATVTVNDVPYGASIAGRNPSGQQSLSLRSNSYHIKVMDQHQFPRYFGAVPIKARNPAKTTVGRVKLILSVLDDTGKRCQPKCGPDAQACDGSALLSTDSKQSDAFSFAPYEKLEPYLNWDLSKHPSRWSHSDGALRFVCYV